MQIVIECNIAGCDIPANRHTRSSHPLCEKHYMRIRRHGNPYVRNGKDDRKSLNYWLDYYRVIPADPNACYGWTGRLHSHGYGLISHNGQTYKAHRLAAELAHGPVPANLDVLHSCDNPPCTNPKHVKAGTAQQNIQDMYERGRHPAKVEISLGFVKQKHEEGYSANAIAAMLNVNRTPVYRAIKELALNPHKPGRTKRHLEVPAEATKEGFLKSRWS